MQGPIALIRSSRLPDFQNLGPLYEWRDKAAYLLVDEVSFRNVRGAALVYFNPPVHQVGNPGLDAYLEGLKAVSERGEALRFLILYGANDPVHAGGDLKESLRNLDKTLELRKVKEAQGAPWEEIDALYRWADDRLRKGFALYNALRGLATRLRLVGVCGGGTRYGGSAEIPLMADLLVGDSRSAVCFSEAMIGLIPGWAGVGRSMGKAGIDNTAFMAKTGTEIKAPELLSIGIYQRVVKVNLPFPRRPKTQDPEADKAAYGEALDQHNEETGLRLLPEALDLATCPETDIPRLKESERATLCSREALEAQVAARKNPLTYADLWGKPLREVKEELDRLGGRPLAPQSIEALDRLLQEWGGEGFEERTFVEEEMKADARLYRDPRFRAGLVATLEQRVADYREVQ